MFSPFFEKKTLAASGLKREGCFYEAALAWPEEGRTLLNKMRGNFFKKFCRQDDGATAVEFALVAIPFFTMLIGTIETCLFFAAGSTLEGGAHEAARVIRTGQAQQSGNAVETFETRLCDFVSGMIPCDQLVYEVISIPTFTDAVAYAPQYDEEGNLVSQGFDTGGVSDTVLVRVAYRYEFLTPFIGDIMENGGAPLTHVSTVVMRNEPYDFE